MIANMENYKIIVFNCHAHTQNKKRTILSLKKEPMLHILNAFRWGSLALSRAISKVSSSTLFYYPFLILCAGSKIASGYIRKTPL